MNTPLYLKPKLRFLSSLLREGKTIPKYYQKYLSNDFIFRTQREKRFIPIKECCEPLKTLIEIKETENMGKGVFAKVNIPEGTYLGCYLGDYVLDIPCKPFEETMYYFETAFHNYAVDGKNETRYLNHSDCNNVDCYDIVHENDIHNGFFAKQEIKEGEQLFIDYGEEYWDKANFYGHFKDEDDPYDEYRFGHLFDYCKDEYC